MICRIWPPSRGLYSAVRLFAHWKGSRVKPEAARGAQPQASTERVRISGPQARPLTPGRVPMLPAVPGDVERSGVSPRDCRAASTYSDFSPSAHAATGTPQARPRPSLRRLLDTRTRPAMDWRTPDTRHAGQAAPGHVDTARDGPEDTGHPTRSTRGPWTRRHEAEPLPRGTRGRGIGAVRVPGAACAVLVPVPTA